MPKAALWTEAVSIFLGRLKFFIIVSIIKLVRDLPQLMRIKGKKNPALFNAHNLITYSAERHKRSPKNLLICDGFL